MRTSLSIKNEKIFYKDLGRVSEFFMGKSWALCAQKHGENPCLSRSRGAH
jgi:hypothetical protein